MSLSYQPLWNELKERNMKKKDLIEAANLSENCVAKMGKNRYISMKNIEKIAITLKLTPSQIFVFVED